MIYRVLITLVDAISLIVILLTSGICGLITGYYREKTKSLIPAIYTHMLVNVIGISFFFLLKK